MICKLIVKRRVRMRSSLKALGCHQQSILYESAFSKNAPWPHPYAVHKGGATKWQTSRAAKQQHTWKAFVPFGTYSCAPAPVDQRPVKGKAERRMCVGRVCSELEGSWKLFPPVRLDPGITMSARVIGAGFCSAPAA